MKFLEHIHEENEKDYFRISVVSMLALLLIIQILGIITRDDKSSIPIASNNASSLLNFCALVSDQLINKKLSPELYNNIIYDGLSKNNYAVLNFNNKEELLISSETKEGCTTILRDDLGVRVFKIGVSKDENNPAYYGVHSFTEI